MAESRFEFFIFVKCNNQITLFLSPVNKNTPKWTVWVAREVEILFVVFLYCATLTYGNGHKNSSENDLLLLLFYGSFVVWQRVPLSVMLRMTPLPPSGARLVICSQCLTPMVGSFHLVSDVLY